MMKNLLSKKITIDTIKNIEMEQSLPMVLPYNWSISLVVGILHLISMKWAKNTVAVN